MSQWCHLNGSIRYDYFSIGGPIKEQEFRTAFFDDPVEKWKECNVPIGSEGSITVTRSVVYENSVQLFVTYVFSGDLRDYDKSDVDDSLMPWLNKIVSKDSEEYLVRQGVLQINLEGIYDIVYTYKGKEDGWVKK